MDNISNKADDKLLITLYLNLLRFSSSFTYESVFILYQYQLMQHFYNIVCPVIKMDLTLHFSN